jgi:GST-like protein
MFTLDVALEKLSYAINCYLRESERHYEVLETHMEGGECIVGTEYSIADISAWGWYGNLILGKLYDAKDFLQVDEYKHIQRWANAMLVRPAVQRGCIINRDWGDEWEQLENRYNAKDVDKVLALIQKLFIKIKNKR